MISLSSFYVTLYFVSFVFSVNLKKLKKDPKKPNKSSYVTHHCFTALFIYLFLQNRLKENALQKIVDFFSSFVAWLSDK